MWGLRLLGMVLFNVCVSPPRFQFQPAAKELVLGVQV